MNNIPRYLVPTWSSGYVPRTFRSIPPSKFPTFDHDDMSDRMVADFRVRPRVAGAGVKNMQQHAQSVMDAFRNYSLIRERMFNKYYR